MQLRWWQALSLLASVRVAKAATQASHVIWNSSPAQQIFYDAMVVGNGRLGATINGYTDHEIIWLNEESVWSGGPQYRVNPAAKAAIPLLHQQMLDGELSAASNNWLANCTGIPPNERRYIPAGQLLLDFGHPWDETTGYNRTLDVSTGLSTVSYEFGRVKYSREFVANYPSNVLAFRLMASQPGRLSFNASLARDQNVTSQSVNEGEHSMLLSGTGSQTDYIHFASKACVVLSPESASIRANDTALMVQGATEALVYYVAETSFRHPDSSNLPKIVDEKIGDAAKAGFISLSAESVADYQQYYNRTAVDFGDSGEMGFRSTTERIANYNNGTSVASDPEMLALTFNTGRYLLIQSSRPDTLPANLQGIWNKDFVPPWGCKFTLDINLEMNYWMTYPQNLPEILSPVHEFLGRLHERGTRVAQDMYGASGWCCHHDTDITADCAPYHQSTLWSPSAMSGAWMSFELVEHWRFSKDTTWAATVAYPILRDAVAFFRTFCIMRDGYWVTTPTCSPENAYVVPQDMTSAGNITGLDTGPMIDRGIMWEIISGFLDISRAIGATEGTEEAAEFLSKVQGPVVGTWGQVLEWSQEFVETSPGMRHFSPLLPVFPGTWVSPVNNKTAADASDVLLQYRMNNGAGGGDSWSVAWATALYARLFHGAAALTTAIRFVGSWVFDAMLSRNGSYFQIDGNCGIVAALTEMLLQSQAGFIHLGPALPPHGLLTGRFRGFKARGGFLVDMSWKDGNVVEATVTSLNGSSLALRVQDALEFTVNGTLYTRPLSTKPGDVFLIAV